MSTARPKALVTAAVSGPGLDLLHELADLVLDSWLDAEIQKQTHSCRGCTAKPSFASINPSISCSTS